MHYYRRNLPHIEKFFAGYFVTFSTRAVSLPPEARSIVLNHCFFENGKRIDLYAVVIMPDHVHMLFAPLEKAFAEPFSLAEIMKGIKGSSAYNINKVLGRKGPMWHEESFDRILRSGDFEKKLNYIIANPIRAGLSNKPGEYPWCWTAQARVPVLHESQ